MVYIPRLTFKSGINPSLAAWFPTNGKYSATQKLMLTRTRIFGDKISGNMPSGMKQWRQTYPARFEGLRMNTLRVYDIGRDIPDYKEQFDDLKDYRRDVVKMREEIRIEKEARKAAKEAKKK